MKSLKKFLSVLLSFVGIFNTLADFNNAPIVPIQVVQKGRQAVLSYLGGKVDHAQLRFYGDSIAAKEWRHLTREDLRRNGYEHDGSFTELFNATSHSRFVGDVVQLSGGGYDLNVEVVYQDADGRTLLVGNGYANVHTNKEGDLVAEFDPWVRMSEDILVEFGRYANAKWVSDNWRIAPEELQTSYNNDETSLVSLPTSMLGEGMILVITYENGPGHLKGYLLGEGGGVIEGQTLIAYIGTVASSDIRLFEDSFDFSSSFGFYEDRDSIYGRPPLVELVLTTPQRGSFTIAGQIWGTKKTLSPTRIVVSVVSVLFEKREEPIPQEFELEYKNGNWFYDLPAGTYHLRADFPDVLDWNLDPNPKG